MLVLSNTLNSSLPLSLRRYTFSPLFSAGQLFIPCSLLEERRIPPYAPPFFPPHSPALHTDFFLLPQFVHCCNFYIPFHLCTHPHSTHRLSLILTCPYFFDHLIGWICTHFISLSLGSFFPSFVLAIVYIPISLSQSFFLSPSWLFKNCLPSDVPVRGN